MGKRHIPTTVEEGQKSLVFSAAMDYVDYGFALLPIAHGTKLPQADLLPTDRRGKPSWTQLVKQPATKQQVEEWFARDPNINIGVICGEPSGGLIVADFDIKPPSDLYIPLTPRVKTHRGEHAYFHIDKPISGCMLKTSDGKEIGQIQAKGYVLLPPSLHPSGKDHYQWFDLLSPWEVTLADVPSWMLGDITNKHREKREASNEYSLLTYPNTCRGTSGRELSAWACLPEFVERAAALLGIPPEAAVYERLGKAFRCVLPGHEDKHPSASLYKGENGVVLYKDWHRAEGVEWFYLAEVRASLAYGSAVKLKSPELAVWHLRLLVETGLLTPAYIPIKDLPLDVRPSVRRVYEGFRLLLGCKWLHTPGAATPFSWGFASAWCGVSERHTGEAIHELLRLGIIKIVGEHRVGIRKSALFLPVESKLQIVQKSNNFGT